MQQQKTINNYYLEQCKWTEQIYKPNKNYHMFGTTTKMYENDALKNYYEMYYFKQVHNLQDQKEKLIFQRLNQLRKIQNEDYIVSINKHGWKRKKETNKLLVLITTDKFSGALGLDKILEDHDMRNYCQYPSKIAAIFHKTAYALQIASKKYQVAHLRLCPSSILVKIPKQRQKISIMMVRLCDFGIGPELKDTINKMYIHPQMLRTLQNSSREVYKMSHNQCFKYDLWSFGVILYETIYGNVPCSHLLDKNASLEDYKKAFTKKNNLKEGELFNDIIIRSLGLENTFENWEEVRKLIEEKHNFSQVQKQPIKSIFMAHVRTMYLFFQIYITMQEKVEEYFEAEDTHTWRNQHRMKILSELLIVCCKHYHQIEFKTFFYSRCHILGPEALIAIDMISKQLKNQLDFLEKSNSKAIKYDQVKELRLEQLYDQQIKKFIIPISMLIAENKEIKDDSVLNVVCKFFSEFDRCITRGSQIFRDYTSGDRQTFITVIYKSKIFEELATEYYKFDYSNFVSQLGIY